MSRILNQCNWRKVLTFETAKKDLFFFSPWVIPIFLTMTYTSWQMSIFWVHSLFRISEEKASSWKGDLILKICSICVAVMRNRVFCCTIFCTITIIIVRQIYAWQSWSHCLMLTGKVLIRLKKVLCLNCHLTYVVLKWLIDEAAIAFNIHYLRRLQNVIDRHFLQKEHSKIYCNRIRCTIFPIFARNVT